MTHSIHRTSPYRTPEQGDDPYFAVPISVPQNLRQHVKQGKPYRLFATDPQEDEHTNLHCQTTVEHGLGIIFPITIDTRTGEPQQHTYKAVDIYWVFARYSELSNEAQSKTPFSPQKTLTPEDPRNPPTQSDLDHIQQQVTTVARRLASIDKRLQSIDYRLQNTERKTTYMEDFFTKPLMKSKGSFKPFPREREKEDVISWSSKGIPEEHHRYTYFNPRYNDKYYYVDATGNVTSKTWENTKTDHERKKFLGIYSSYQAAAQRSDYLRFLLSGKD